MEKKKKNKDVNYCVIIGSILIVLLLLLIALIGFRPEGFASKILVSKSSKLETGSGNCYYKDTITGQSRLTLTCQKSTSKGYFCESTVNFREKPYVLEKDSCKSLNTCFDGIKNQDETGIDCGGVCGPCANLYCTQNSDCQTGDSCSSGYCNLETNQCVMSSQPNGTICGESMVCQFGSCKIVSGIVNTPDDNLCKLSYIVSDPVLEIQRCSDPVRQGFEYSRTHIGEQIILTWPGSQTNPNVEPTKILINGNPVSQGSIIGVFQDANGFQVNEGFAYWANDLYNQTPIFVSAQSPYFPTWGGMEDGTEFIWKVWDKDTNTIYNMTPTYYTLEELGVGYGYSQNNFFSYDALTVLKKLENTVGCQSNSSCEDSNPCTNDLCIQGSCQNTNVSNGQSCGQSMICQNGNCITPQCIVSSDCEDGNPCTNNTCSNNVCSSVLFPNNTSCGQGMVCQSGSCVAEPECSINTNCQDNNPCTNNLCSNGQCTFPNLPNNTSCGQGMVCQSGSCVQEPECSVNTDCEAGYTCVNGTCMLETNPNGTSCVINSNCQSTECSQGVCNTQNNLYTITTTSRNGLFNLNNDWYLFASNKIYKYTSDFSSYQLIEKPIGNVSNSFYAFSDGTNWYLNGGSASNKIKKYNLNFDLIEEITLIVPDKTVTSVKSVYKVNNEWYTILGINSTSNYAVKFNNNWTYMSTLSTGLPGVHLYYLNNNWYLRANSLTGDIYKYSFDFATQISTFDLQEYKTLANVTTLSKHSMFYKNGWYVVLGDGKTIYKFNDTFNVTSQCFFDNTIYNGNACTNGFCQNGICNQELECNINSDCVFKADEMFISGLNSCFKVDDEIYCVGANKSKHISLTYNNDKIEKPAKLINNKFSSNEVSKISFSKLYSDGDYFLNGFSCALLNNNLLKCWGSSTYLSSLVDPDSLYSSFEIGQNHMCAVALDKTVHCKGFNFYGQLGNGTNVRNSISFTPVLNLSNVSQISLGSSHSCALLNNGTLKCWGGNDAGQLGDGTTTDRTTPVNVSGLTNVKQISLGQNHSCALLNDGTVKCWGGNDAGQLGDNTTTLRKTPVTVSGLTNVEKISVGLKFNVALLSDGSVKLWGMWNQNYLTPIVINHLNNVLDVQTGSYHACALLSDHRVKCWGVQNNSNQIGFPGGTFPNSSFVFSANYDCINNTCKINDVPECKYDCCQQVSDCTDDTFCKNHYCNIETSSCISEPINQNQFCEAPLSFCGNTYCGFNPIIVGLCNEYPQNTGTVLGMVIMNSARQLNNGETVLGVSAKYIDNNVLKCGGAKDFPSTNTNIIVSIFGNDNTTPEKDGFNGGEYINLYIRTTNYVCKVNGTFNVETGYVTNQKWYSTSLAKLLTFKDFTTGSTTIDFSNTENCTYLGPVN